jgi:excisionase family DNA binding protein
MELIVVQKQELTQLIQDAVAAIQPAQHQRIELIDREELCRRLSISEPTVIRWEAKGKIPAIHMGSIRRYNWPKVVEALESKGGAK